MNWPEAVLVFASFTEALGAILCVVWWAVKG
jgi:hypothetical protein